MKPLVKFGIYLARVHFAENPRLYKIRPVVIMKIFNDEVLAYKITSNNFPGKYPKFFLKNWRNYNLDHPSSINLDGVVRLVDSNIFSSRFLGILNESDVDYLMRCMKHGDEGYIWS